MEYVTVSAKIPKKLRQLLRKYGIKPGPVIRKALEEAVKEHIAIKLEEKAKRLTKYESVISDEEVAQLIREERER